MMTGFNWHKIISSGGSCEHGDEHSGSINILVCLNQLNDYQLLKKDPAPWSYLIKVIDFLYVGNWCSYGKNSSNENTQHLRTLLFLATLED
jgi:hypothetical protein